MPTRKRLLLLPEAPPARGAGPQSAAPADKPADDNVVDAEFTEVKEKK